MYVFQPSGEHVASLGPASRIKCPAGIAIDDDGLCMCVMSMSMLLLLRFSFFFIQYCYYDEFIFHLSEILKCFLRPTLEFCNYTIYIIIIAKKTQQKAEIQAMFNINMTAR